MSLFEILFKIPKLLRKNQKFMSLTKPKIINLSVLTLLK